MGSGKKDLLTSLQSCLADLERYLVDAERREFDSVSNDYAVRVMRDIEKALQECIGRAEGL